MKKIYLFDFDGTLTYKDSMFLFLRFFDAAKYWGEFLKHMPLFVLVKLSLVDAEKVKKSFISAILKGKREEVIAQKAREFLDVFYPKLIRKNALDFIDTLEASNIESYLVTASLDIWTAPFAEKWGMKLIATEAQFENGVFTGNFKTKNNNKEEKAVRMQRELQGKKYDKIIAFGDSSGDKPMMALAHEAHYRFFH